MLFDFFLFHHVQFVLVGVDEFILQEAQTLIRNHFNTHRVFQFPFPTERESSALDKCCNIRMYVQGEFLHVVFVDQAVDLSFQAVGKQDRGLMVPVPKQVGQASDVSTSIAGRTRWRVICIRPNLLSGRILCFARSLAIAFVICSNSFCRLAASAISIKSTTIIPPISRKRN